MAVPTLRSGIFLAPFHPTEEDPTLAIRRDLELMEWLDRLGYEEAWIGEHHSAGYESIASPGLFLAAAAQGPTPDPPRNRGHSPPLPHPPDGGHPHAHHRHTNHRARM